MAEKSMTELVERICDLFEKDRARSGIKDARPKVYSPAAPSAVRAFEKRIGSKIPVPYLEFLEVTNGMREYQGVFTFIGVEGEHTEKALTDIEKRRGLYTREWERKHGKATEEAIATFERKMDLSKDKEADAHIFPGNKFVFGTDFLGSLYYFVPTGAEETERRVIWRDNQEELVVYDSFRGMLERDTRVLSMRLGIET
jgi:SMI1 / KNR4 family (SUKH-1)